MFYYEKMNSFGRWSPRASPDRPVEKSEAGSRQRIRCVVEVPPAMQAFDLDSLQYLLGTKENAV